MLYFTGMVIRGEAEEIIYRNEENGYSVVVLNVEGLPVTATGVLPVIAEGEFLECEGEYKNNPKYGTQFEIKRITAVRPDTAEGILRYLSSGIIKGIGPAKAEAIVNKFGKAALDVIEFSFAELAKIKGISLKRAGEIHDGYMEKAGSQKAVMFLQSHDISLNTAGKIYGRYRDKTEKLITENPYRLIEDIDGIGFLTADRIAKKLGIKHDDAFRIKAGIIHALKEASDKNGHTYLPENELKESAAGLLQVSLEDNFISALRDMAVGGLIRLVNLEERSAGTGAEKEKAEDGAAQASEAGGSTLTVKAAGRRGKADNTESAAGISGTAGGETPSVNAPDRESSKTNSGGESGCGEVSAESKAGLRAVMLAKFMHTEKGIAAKLTALGYGCETNGIDAGKAIREFERVNGVEFHEAQRRAIVSSLESGVHVITGGPGTGKTTIIKCILDIIVRNGHTPVLLAPTGRAAKRMAEAVGREAKTIHRALLAEGEDGGRGAGRFGHNELNPMDATFFIVDEVSMVDCTLMYSLLKAIRPGSRLLLVGDKDQLPSVGAGNVLADLLGSGIIKASYLTQVYRQAAESRIVTNAHLINSGEMPVLDDKSERSDFFFLAKDTPEEIYGAVLDLASARLPKFMGIDASKIQILSPMKNGAAGVHALNRGAQAVLNPYVSDANEIRTGADAVRLGDKVMQTANNYDLEWTKRTSLNVEAGSGVFNGDIGFVTQVNRAARSLSVEFEDGRIAEYTPENLEELTPAYAITVHKSQGCEFDAAVIPVTAGSPLILTRNLLYTAVTRAKKLVVLVGSKYGIKRMIDNNYSQKRYSMLKRFLKEAAESMSV